MFHTIAVGLTAQKGIPLLFSGPLIRILAMLALIPLCPSPIGPSAIAAGPGGDSEAFDWRSDFAVKKSFDITLDTTGYSFPTAIAFVPNPGPAPDDPLYYVTELRGSVKVVTNDRQIIEFAKVPAFDPVVVLPDTEAESGLAGICLDPAHGYIFITYTANDSNGLLRNHLQRYDTKPATFALAPKNQTEIAPVLSREQSGVSHQIGGCRVEGESLYVSLGDAGLPGNSQNIDRLLGKVVRMTLDGEPHPGNPYFGSVDPGSKATRKFVWASGLRNPFGIDLVDGRVYVADNGISLDRFLRLAPGANYLWDGLDWSIAAAADAVFSPSVGPVHLQRYPKGSKVFPESYRDHFFFSASSGIKGGIVAVPYDLAAGRTVGTPFYLVKQTQRIMPGVVGLAFGPDGLYFSAIMPNRAGQTPILKLTYNPQSRYPNLIGGSPASRILNETCRGCHLWKGNGGMIGPRLDSKKLIPKIGKRLNSDSYRETVAGIDKISEEPFISTRQARAEVLEAKGMDQIRAYFMNKILEPRFDNPNAQMPKLRLAKDRVSDIVEILMLQPEKNKAESLFIRTGKRIRALFPFPHGRKGDIAVGAVVGFVAGILLFAGARGVRRWLDRG